jgi:hypothetical protein
MRPSAWPLFPERWPPRTNVKDARIPDKKYYSQRSRNEVDGST